MTNENLNQSEYDVQTTTDGTTGTETEDIEHLHNYDYLALDIYLKNAYYNCQTGNLVVTENAQTTGLISCYPDEKFRVSCTVNSDVVGIVYFDNEENLIGYALNKLSEDDTQTFDAEEFVVPSNCKYIAFQSLKDESNSFSVEKYNDIKAIYESKIDNNHLHFYPDDYVSFNLPLVTGYYNYQNGQLLSHTNAYTTGLIKCCPGEKYNITSMTMYYIAVVVFFDCNKAVIGYDGFTNGESVTKDIIIPPNCAYVAFQKHKDAPNFEIKKYNALKPLYELYENLFVEHYKELDSSGFIESQLWCFDKSVLTHKPNAPDWHTTGKIPCNPDDKFIVSGFVYKGAPDGRHVVLFLDKDNNLLGCVGVATKNEPATIYHEFVTAPKDTAFVIFNSFYTKQSGIVTKGIELSVKKFVREPRTECNMTEVMNVYNNPLYGKKMFVDGDSIAQGAKLVSYADIIAQRNDMILTKTAVGGTTIAESILNEKTTQEDGETKTTDYKSIYKRVTEMNGEYDYILLEGGWNDMFNSGAVPLGLITDGYDDSFDTNTTIGAMEAICKYLTDNYFNTPKLFVLGHKKIGQLVLQNTYWECIKAVLEKWGIPYIDLRNETPLAAINQEINNAYFEHVIDNNKNDKGGDGTHPNCLAYEKFYVPLIEAKLKSL